jgi:hypothetical protein
MVGFTFQLLYHREKSIQYPLDRKGVKPRTDVDVMARREISITAGNQTPASSQ